jgi:uncharacterized protein YndB with AHSA1/START domain
MPEYEQSGTIPAPPERLFEYLSDVRHLPEYFPRMVRAEPAGGETVAVEGDGDDGRHRGVAWFHVDDAERRIEWGAERSPYHGWLQVDPAGEASLVTIHLHQEHAGDTDADLAQALEYVRRHFAAGS